MAYSSKISTAPDTQSALDECMAGLAWTGPTDLALVFFSPHHRKQAEHIAEFLYGRLQPRSLLGCPGETIIGSGREIEKGPALSLWVARWGEEVEVTPFHLT